VTVLTTRHELRRRWVRRWVRLSKKSDAADTETVTPDTDAREALTRFYAILDRVNVNDRAAFALRYMEGLELTEVASALGLSLATTKRRLSRVWNRVVLLVDRDPLLAQYRPKLVPENPQ
jgi:RNA polymerase sigma-70 factor (ECF subfamily)